ncbi:ComEA family DNA-binding protein [Legionella spiritensis]|uniref:Competence protein ComEA n=1 Tax=Legionella spiritensis TaxID=452 RepID=A0A0W0YYQ8_LEGSP|nr:helix-hairpin-helix domain-containing protein [Legionella spiritensis]KTD61638.1 competence protein ComEA [Legionella spiritensis]SNV39247.1 competence protein ComEA [Legionella spiritensis]VEG90350.1 competence protein ComEA [Legionella spiritensis]
MKANVFAVVLSCLLLALPVHAVTHQEPSQTGKISASAKINLNQADAKTLTHSIKSIGKKRAEAIVKYREAHHDFKSLDELSHVPGLGKSFVNRLRAELERVFTLQ